MINKYKSIDEEDTSKVLLHKKNKSKKCLENAQQITLLIGVIGIVLCVGLFFDTLIQFHDGTFNTYFLNGEEIKYNIEEELQHDLPWNKGSKYFLFCLG